MDSHPALNLYQARPNSILKLVEIAGGWSVRRSLYQLGIHAGDRVRFLRRAPFGGPVVIRSHGSEVAIGKQLAEKLTVEVMP